LLAVWFPFLPHYNVYPLADVFKLSPSFLLGAAYAVVIGGLFLLMGLSVRATSLPSKGAQLSDPHLVQPRNRTQPVTNKAVKNQIRPLLFLVISTLLFAIPLLFTFPINATDIYRYFLRGRISTIYAENPYVTPPAAFPDDEYTILAGEWIDATTPYGPVWEMTAAGVVWLSSQNLRLGLLLFKGIGLLAHLGIGLLIYATLAANGTHPAGRVSRTMLWLWNPALLLTFVANGHNDALMLLWLVLGYAVWQRGHAPAGFLLLCLAPLTKLIALLPLPFFFLAMWRDMGQNAYPGRERLRFLLITIPGGLILTFLAFLPFGSPFQLLNRLLNEATANGGFSPTTLLWLIGRATGLNIPIDRILQVSTLLFILVALWLLWRTWRGRPAVRAAADVFAAYLATAFTFRIWYPTWLFPWLLLDQEGDPRRLDAGLWFLLCAQLSVVIYGHLHRLIPGFNSLATHLVGVPFVFLFPLLMAWGTAYIQRRSGHLQTVN
jgi:hypothetical protein